MKLEIDSLYKILATLKKFCEKNDPLCNESEQGQKVDGPAKDNTNSLIWYQLELFESLLLQSF